MATNSGTSTGSAGTDSGIGPSASSVTDLESEIAALSTTQQQYNLVLGNSTQLGNQFAKSLSTAFVGLAAQGRSLGDVMSSLALSLSQITLTAALKPLTNAFSNSLTSFIASPSLFSSSGSVAAPSGFSFGAGSLFSSGDSGAPLGTPSAAFDTASPAPSPNIVFNVTTPDAQSFSRSETQLAAMLSRSVAQGNRNL
ncbi:MAG: phage tail tape measure protein [Proteobacteria bacterium]|nr:phage tail tape measure protein [Pseudomonadota bacterium]